MTAAAKIAWYITEGRRRGSTGVSLREVDEAYLATAVSGLRPRMRLPSAG